MIAKRGDPNFDSVKQGPASDVNSGGPGSSLDVAGRYQNSHRLADMKRIASPLRLKSSDGTEIDTETSQAMMNEIDRKRGILREMDSKMK